MISQPGSLSNRILIESSRYESVIGGNSLRVCSVPYRTKQGTKVCLHFITSNTGANFRCAIDLVRGGCEVICLTKTVFFLGEVICIQINIGLSSSNKHQINTIYSTQVYILPNPEDDLKNQIFADLISLNGPEKRSIEILKASKLSSLDSAASLKWVKSLKFGGWETSYEHPP